MVCEEVLSMSAGVLFARPHSTAAGAYLDAHMLTIKLIQE